MSCRPNQATMSVAQKQAFVNAVIQLKNSTPSRMGLSNRYDDYVMTHMNSMMLMSGSNRVPGWAHRGPAFFAWHRVMLRQFELDLQAIDPAVSLPYWDWTVDNSPVSSIWDPVFLGGNGRAGDHKVMSGPFAFDGGKWPLNIRESGDSHTELRRDFTAGASTLPTPTQVSDCINNEIPFDVAPWALGDSPSFRDRAEGWHGLGSIHNRVHLWIGGSMLPSTSPNDPVFFLHHCNIDRLLSLWQRQHTLENYHPTGSGGETGPLGHNLNDTLLFHDPLMTNPFSADFTVASTWNHHTMGYWYDTDPPEVNLLTPSLSFTDIPEGVGSGVTTYRAVVFEILSCAPVTLQITAGPTPPFGAPLGLDATVTPDRFDAPTHGRLWISYTSTAAGASTTGSVTVHVVETGQTWVINIAANTVARPKSAVVLVLDHSGSMSEDAGDGQPKVAKLKEAVSTFVNLMLPGDGLSIVRFDDTVQRLSNVTDVGPVSPVTPGSGRDQANGIVAGTQLDPAGDTSIGGGVAEGRAALDAAVAAPPYSVKAMIVVTDGEENTPPWIDDVSGSLSANTFAVGIGTPANISTAALNKLTQNHNGYLVVTGAITPDISYRLSKYFLQILAGISNANVILDPSGELVIGAVHRIPFLLTEADYASDVILLSPAPAYIDFKLETPGGDVIDPARAAAEPAIDFYSSGRSSYYRASLPALPATGSHAGLWHAILAIGRRGRAGNIDSNAVSVKGTLPYDLLVHGYSNLRLRARLTQKSNEPGAGVVVTASLTEYGVPVEKRAYVQADVTRPDSGTFTIALTERECGQFEARFIAAESGLYTVRIRANGTTFYGKPFQREQTLTAATVAGGDRDPRHPGDDPLCRLVECLLGKNVLGDRFYQKLKEMGIDFRALEKCLVQNCKPSRDVVSKKQDSAAQKPLKGPRRRALATLKLGKQVDRRVRSEKMTGPMFDLSPEDKAIERKEKQGKKDKKPHKM